MVVQNFFKPSSETKKRTKKKGLHFERETLVTKPADERSNEKRQLTFFLAYNPPS